MASNTNQTRWQHCIDLIHSKLNEQQYTTWFSRLKFHSFNEETKILTVCIPSQFIFEYLEANYRKLIHFAIFKVFGDGVRLAYKVTVARNTSVVESGDEDVIEASNTENKTSVGNDIVEPQPVACDLDPQLNPSKNFQSFIEGNANRLTRTVGVSIAEHPEQQTFNPFFVYGPSGCGKTHLVNAIGVRMKELFPEKRVLYVSAHLFRVQYVDSVRQNTSNDFINFYSSLDTLIIDDIQEFAGQEKTLNTFFHIFNHLHQNGKQIIMTADRPPATLPGMEERMITRFKWGLEAQMEAPDYDLRCMILKEHIRRNGLTIPEDVVTFIAENIQGSIRELEGMIHSLLAYSVVGSCKIDLAFAREILKKNTTFVTHKVSPDEIIKACATCSQLRVADLIGSSRKANIVQARQIAMYLMHKYTDMTANAIGKHLGGKTHATVLYGVNNVEQTIQTDSSLRKIVEEIKTKIQ